MSQHESAPARPLYDEVERIRLRNGWTKVQLAKRAGVGRNTIDNWRTQPRAPLAPTVKDVAERLGIAADLALRLAGITGSPQPPAAEVRVRPDHDELRDADADDDGLQDLVNRARRERDNGDPTLYLMLLRLQGLTEPPQETGGRADETSGGKQQAS